MSTQTVEAPAGAPQAPAPKGKVRGGLLDPKMLLTSLPDAFKKLDPRTLWRNPVMFVVEIVSAATTVLFVRDLLVGSGASFSGQISLWLWFTVLFADSAEALAEGRGKAQAGSLRRT